MTLSELNGYPHQDCVDAFLKCCGSRAWASAMESARPFTSLEALLGAARENWWKLSEGDWKEAFSCHPKIGDKKGSAWSRQEQSGVLDAHEKVLSQLREGNEAYERKFGFVFLVCATGKSAQEMLGILNSRINRGYADELAQAAKEQDAITRIRLGKLLGEI